MVEVGSAVWGPGVGEEISVDGMGGTSAAVQAVRRRKAMTMKLFIERNYMSSFLPKPPSAAIATNR
jgi:hypothetical protein